MIGLWDQQMVWAAVVIVPALGGGGLFFGVLGLGTWGGCCFLCFGLGTWAGGNRTLYGGLALLSMMWWFETPESFALWWAGQLVGCWWFFFSLVFVVLVVIHIGHNDAWKSQLHFALISKWHDTGQNQNWCNTELKKRKKKKKESTPRFGINIKQESKA